MLHPETIINKIKFTTNSFAGVLPVNDSSDCVGAFDGKTVKFRLLIEEEPTIDEAKKLFSEVLKTIEIYTNNEETWNYYNASLEIAYKDTLYLKVIRNLEII